MAADPAIDVAAGLIFRAGKLLLTQRPPGSHLENLWEFPGGKREYNETFEQCLKRELFEELGIEVEVGALLEQVTHSYQDKRIHLKFYRCTLLLGEPQPIGCQAIAWVTAPQLLDFQFPAADEKVLKKLRSSTSWWTDSP